MSRIDPSQVSAVLVTRGNVDMQPIVDSLIFDDVVVWDNSVEPQDQMTYGRCLAIARAKHPIIYSQDDDLIHSAENQLAILDHYQPGVMVGCMWDEWSAGARAQGIWHGYDDLVFAGSGSVYDSTIPSRAAARYLECFPLDDFFRLWADTIIGIIANTHQIDVRFEILPSASADYRMCNQSGAVQDKKEAIRRARAVRDLVRYRPKQDAHQLYMHELVAGRKPEHRYL